nr:choice-of-anchor J domain-containing protein [uncultured Carboxylicivirga sp.]
MIKNYLSKIVHYFHLSSALTLHRASIKTSLLLFFCFSLISTNGIAQIKQTQQTADKKQSQTKTVLTSQPVSTSFKANSAKSLNSSNVSTNAPAAIQQDESQKMSTKQAKLTQSDKLRVLSTEFAKKSDKKRAIALQMAKENGWVIKKEVDGRLMELQGIDENNRPLYYITTNAGAAKTTSTDKVYEGGALGLSLDGTGVHAAVWDGGAVRPTHQEFTNTGTSRIHQSDGVTATNYHSTHVAGTMIAAGVDADAKGMAFNGELNTYDWTNDISEMAADAANGLLISNHSYGYVQGWSSNGISWTWYGDPDISDQEDYRFGFYSSSSKDLDQVAYSAPYYLILKAAGNDRGDGPTNGEYPQDGPYDCIGTAAAAKNIMTVGAVNELANGYTGNPGDVIMSSFSAWGPVDDGRIKPDIVAKGVQTYSTYDDDDQAYNTISGTSMATPAVSGSLMLLQQHYHNLNGEYMKSATLKGVAIHTADECGSNPGPDYVYGWGLLNTASAAELISNNNLSTLIQERTYSGDEQTITVKASGAGPLVVSMVWTDVEGTPVAPQLDPADAMLVNDLDIKVSADGTDFYPYKLDKDNPEAAATTGVNDVDNVEKIVIDNPVAGETYTITISHKGTITNSTQDFSLIVSGIVMEGVYTATLNVSDADGIVDGATVVLNGLTKKTNAEGSVTFIVEDGKTYEYTVSKYGYYDATGSFTVAGDNLVEGVTLTGLPSYDITFNVSSSETSEPIQYANIEIDGKSGLTDATGSVTISGIIEGEQEYTVSANEFTKVSGTITVSENSSIDISLDPSPVLWDNYSTVETTNGIVSTNLGGLGEIPAGLIESADDFIVPEGAVWNDIDIYAYGFSSNTPYPESFYMVIYGDNDGVPGDIIFEQMYTPLNVEEPVFPLNNMNLTPGKYWISISGHYPEASAVSAGRWNIYTVIETQEGEAMLRDHPDAFSAGATDWTSIASLTGDATVSLKFAIYKGVPRYATTLTLKDQNGDPVVNASIEVEDNGTIVSDENGVAEINLPDGDHNYTITLKGYDTYTGTLTVNGVESSVDVTLNKQPHYNATFTISNEEGNPLPNAILYIDDQSVTSDESGIAIASILPGTYTYTVSLSEYEAATGELTITDSNVEQAVTLIFNGEVLFESFEGDISRWTMVDADGDGNNWYVFDTSASSTTEAMDGDMVITSASYASGVLTPENWLISPEIDLSEKSGVYFLEYYVAPQDASWAGEHYKCVISTTGSEVSDFTDDNILYEETMEVGDLPGGFTKRSFDVSEYCGQKIHIAWVHYDCSDMFRMNLDAIKVYQNLTTDAGVTAITAPNNDEDCSLSSEEAVTATVYNYGGYDITSLTMSYTINDDTPVTETFDDITIAPGTSQEITFSQTADLSELGAYTVKVESNLDGDDNTDNDAKEVQIANGDAVITVHVFTDSGTQDVWTIKDENGEIIRQHSNYQWNIEETTNVCVVADGCYTFEFNGFTEGDNETPSETAWVELLYNGDVIWGGETPGNAGEPIKVEYIGSCSNLELYNANFEVTFGDKPVEATISMNDNTYSTDADGLASIVLPEGEYEYTISADGYFPKTGTLTIAGADATVSEDLLMKYNMFFEGFEGDISGWIMIDNDGDTYQWEVKDYSSESDAVEGSKYISSDSWNSSGGLLPENWLISPEIDLTNTSVASLSYFIGPQSTGFADEHYKCIVSTTGSEISDFPDENIIYEETVTPGTIGRNFKQIEINLEDYLGQVIRIAWVHFDTDNQWSLNMDAIAVSAPISSDATISTTLKFTDVNQVAIENVEVTLDGTTKTTDAQGLVEFSSLVEGTSYDYTVIAPRGYKNSNGSITAVADQTTELTIGVVSPANFEVVDSPYTAMKELSWVNSTTSKWFQYDDGIVANGIGTNDEATFDAAIMLDEDDLSSYDDYAITKFAFVPNINASSEGAVFEMKLWDAEANVLYSQEIDEYTPNQLNIIDLDAPYVIDASEPIYIGYTVQTPGGHPIAASAGPATPGKSDLLNLGDGFVSAFDEYELDYNWMIRAFVTSDYDVVNNIINVNPSYQVLSAQPNASASSISTIEIATPIVVDQPILLDDNDFSFNVYRNDELLSTVSGTSYSETVEPGVYNYYVTSVFNGAESEPSNTIKTAYYGDNTTDRKTVLFESVINTEMANSAGIEIGLQDLVSAGYDVSNINYAVYDDFENDFSSARVNDYYEESSLSVRADGGNRQLGGGTGSLFANYENAYLARIDEKSIFDLDINITRVDADKCEATINVSELFKLYESGYVLQLALVENNIEFAWDEDHTHINSLLREMYPNALGTALDLTEGSQTITIDFDVDSEINTDNFEVIAFVQQDATHEVMQAVKTTIPEVGAHQLTFEVKDGDNNAIENADIVIDGKTLHTNTSGSTSIWLVDGTYNYTVSLEGYVAASSSVTIAGDNTTEIVTLVSTGLSDITSSEIRLYPNPVKDMLNVELPATKEDQLVQVVSATGSILKTVEVPAGADQAQINFTDLPRGIYLINIIHNDQSIKLVKIVK